MKMPKCRLPKIVASNVHYCQDTNKRSVITLPVKQKNNNFEIDRSYRSIHVTTLKRKYKVRT